MPVQKVRHIRIAMRHQAKERTDILHVHIEGVGMSAQSTRSAMTAQVEASQGIARLGQRCAYMNVTRGMFSQPVDQRDEGFWSPMIGFPALDEKSCPLLACPLGFEGFHVTLPVAIWNSQVSCPIALQDISSTSNPCPVAQERLSRIKPWVTKQIGCESLWPWVAGEAWSTTSR